MYLLFDISNLVTDEPNQTNKVGGASCRRSGSVLITFDVIGPRRKCRCHSTVAPVATAAVEHRPRAAVGRRPLVLAQQRRVVVDTASGDVTGRRRTGNGSGNGRNDLDVAEVVGLARHCTVAIALGRRAHALQFTCSVDEHTFSSLSSSLRHRLFPQIHLKIDCTNPTRKRLASYKPFYAVSLQSYDFTPR